MKIFTNIKISPNPSAEHAASIYRMRHSPPWHKIKSTTIFPTDDCITSIDEIKSSVIPFPKDGLKLSYLIHNFFDIFGGKDNLKGKTTAEVNLELQRKTSSHSKLSFCDYLRKEIPHHPPVGKATVFISHAWKYEFLDVIQALEHHFRNEPDVIIWFDVFSVNQHIEKGLDYSWWCSSFKSAIEQFGRTVIVLAPWHDPIPLRRGWCLFELYCTIVTGSKLEVAMSKSNTDTFIKDISREPVSMIKKMQATIDVEKSECWKQEDKQRIFDLVRKEVGFVQVNKMIFNRMREWIIESAESARAMDKDNLTLLSSVATLYRNQGRYSEAEPLYLECLKKRKLELGDSHPDTLSAMNNLANLYDDQGKYAEAEPLYLECLAKREVVLGESHPDTLSSVNNLANIYQIQGKYCEAEPLYLKCLKASREALGETHPDTLSSMNNLANLYGDQGKYSEAEPLYLESLTKRQAVLGDMHPDTLISMNNLAALYDDQGKYSEAEPLYLECLKHQAAVLGDSHPDTLSSMNNLAGLYMYQRKYSQAEPLYLECLTKRSQALGETHPDTLISVNGLAILYLKQGKYSQAEPLYLDCLKKRKLTLKDTHPETLSSMNGLAILYLNQGKYLEAESLLAECLRKRVVVLGENHPETKKTASSLAELQRKIKSSNR